MLFFNTLSFLYLRYFFIVLIALCSFMVGFDLMEYASDLPPSANLVLIYIMYKFFYAIDMMLPISLVFAMIASLVEMVRSNAMVAYYAIGYSKNRLFSPFLIVSALVLSVYIAFHTTSFARANEYANNLRESSELIRPTSNLFFTHEGNYVYFGNLYPLSRKAEDIRIFTFSNGRFTEALSASKAVYQDGFWVIEKAHLVHAPKTLELGGEGIVIEDRQNIKVLPEFRPKILDQVYEGKVNFPINDGLEALQLLENQNVDVAKIKSALYRMVVSPWFAVILMVIFFTFAPISGRFVNLSLFSFGAILATLLIWGILFMLGELSVNKTLSPEAGVLFPILLLASIMALRLSRFRIKSRQN